MRRDENESELVTLARQLGWFLTALELPCDQLGLYGRRWYPIEIKLPFGPKGGSSDRKLTPTQVQWHEDARWYGGPVFTWRTAEDVVATTNMLTKT